MHAAAACVMTAASRAYDQTSLPATMAGLSGWRCAISSRRSASDISSFIFSELSAAGPCDEGARRELYVETVDHQDIQENVRGACHHDGSCGTFPVGSQQVREDCDRRADDESQC